MAKIDLTRQAKGSQQSGQFLRTTNVTSSLTGEYGWETADFNFTGSFTESFTGSFKPERIVGLGIVSSSTQVLSHFPGTVSRFITISSCYKWFTFTSTYCSKNSTNSKWRHKLKHFYLGIPSGSEVDNQTLTYNPVTFGLSISNGNSVDLSSLKAEAVVQAMD